MKAVELFAGAGGLGMGVSKAGFRPIEIVEWDRWCCDTINRNRERGVHEVKNWPEPFHDDVRRRTFSHLEGKIDLVSGGPPCQPFSLGGKHRAYDDDRDLWPQAVRAVREIRPKAFIFENVKGLTRSSFTTYLSYIVLQLQHPAIARCEDENWRNHFGRLQQHHSSNSCKEPEYRVLFEILNAADYGVPQRRERVVFVGIRADLNLEWKFPSPTHSMDALLWSIVRSTDYWDRHKVSRLKREVDCRLHSRAQSLRQMPPEKPWLTVRDAIHDLPEPNAQDSSSVFNHRQQAGARTYAGHTGSPLDLPAKTLKAGVHGVPGGENMLLLPDGRVRYFTVRESARLQTFPDNFELHGSWSEAMRQLGNAVPVELARIVAANVASHLKLAI